MRPEGVMLGLIAAFLAACASTPPRPSPTAAPALLTPPPPRVETWTFEGHTGSLIHTRSYRLFTTTDDAALVAELPGFLEHALDRYTTVFGPLPRPPMTLDTFLLGDRTQWASLTRQAMGHSAETYLKIERGGFASGGRALLWPIGRRDTLAIAAHEGWHQYTQRTFRDELPVWLEEGIGTYMEGLAPDPVEPTRLILSAWANPERIDQLRRAAIRGDLLPLPRLLEATPERLIDEGTERALTYYAQVWSLVHFLREGEGGRHAAALHRLLRDAAGGRLHAQAQDSGASRGAAVFRFYFADDVAAAEFAYARFIAEIVR